jgi:hypothetical protein
MMSVKIEDQATRYRHNYFGDFNIGRLYSLNQLVIIVNLLADASYISQIESPVLLVAGRH